MRKKEKKQAHELSVVPGVTVIALAFAAVFVVLFLFLWRSGMMVSVFGGIFSSSAEEGSEGERGSIELPESSGISFDDEHFYTPDLTELPEDKAGIAALLRAVRSCERYEQTLSVSYNEGTAVTVKVLRDGNRYRVETENMLVICDGELVYLRELGGIGPYEHRWRVTESDFSVKDEMGIPFLEDIISAVENSTTTPRINFDERDKVLLLSDITENDLVKAVSITLETGMVTYVSAAMADGTHLYRCFNTSYSIDPVFPAGAFTVPSPTTGG